MDTARWQHVRAIFEHAAERPPAERQTVLDQACGDDDDLRREVLSLLAAYDDETPFLDDPLSIEALLLLSKEDPAGYQMGTRIGPYRLVGELGHGGMGTVYLAERADGQFDKRVAIKLVRHGHVSDDLIRRFRHERQILASLKHPGIARLLDGGVTEPTSTGGLPYLVMEYVEGVPIDQYCNTHGLTTRQRLDLFRTACDAVQYAHQNLIIHRDLKPSNIFVTASSGPAEQPRVKLLDFGIAKLLDDETSGEAASTRTGARPMTPEYASPEQVRGAPMTTASDVYALGVILYELLTGHRPYTVRGLTPSAIEQVICEHNPPRPSTAVLRTDNPTPEASGKAVAVTPAVVSQARRTHPERLRRKLRGDLDTIVLKALHKDPSRRYGLVAELSEDIRRHLRQLPIHARPDTMGYRLSKFMRRHTMGVAATALIILALLGGIVTTTYQARVAQWRFDQVRTLSNTILLDLHDAIRDLPGATTARKMLVTNALTYLDNLNQEAGGDPSLQFELADAYEQVGEIQGDPHYTNLGDLAGAMASYQKAFALREDLWLRDTTNATARHALANSYGDVAVVTSWSGDNDQAITLSKRALALLAPLTEPSQDDGAARHDEGRIRSELGWWLIWAGRTEEGLVHLAAAVTRLEAVALRQPEHLDLHLDLWRAYSYQVDGLRFTARDAEALTLLEGKGLALLQRLERRWPTQPRVQHGLNVCLNFIGEMHNALGARAEAMQAYQASLRVAETLVNADSSNQKAYESLARSHASIGSIQVETGHLDDAVASYRSVIAIYQMLNEQNPQNVEIDNMLGNGHRTLCKILLDAGRLEAALTQCRQGIAVQEAVVAAYRENLVVLGNLGSVYAYTARIYRALSRRAAPSDERLRHHQEALAWYDRGIAIFDQKKALHNPVDWEVHPDSLAAEREAFLRANCEWLMAHCE